MKKDYYEVLKVSRSATEDEIKKSYRRLAQEYHPDKNPNDPKSEEMFKELGAAYEVLMNAEKRAAYDRFGHDGPNASAPRGGFNPFDVFNSVFNGGGFSQFFHGNNHQQTPGDTRQRGEDLLQHVQMTLEEVHTGVEREFVLKRFVSCTSCNNTGCKTGTIPEKCGMCQGRGTVNIMHGPFHISQPCPNCHGSGAIITAPCTDCNGDGRRSSEQNIKINIPRGIETNTRLRVASSGSIGVRGGPTGDLFFHVEVVPHNFFTRSGYDLNCKTDIPFVTAALGGEIPIQGISGTHTLNIPPGTQSGTMLRLSGKGLVASTSETVGDVIVQINVRVPTDLSKEQRDTLLLFASL